MLDKTYVLSPQQLLDCDTNDNGCNGGNNEYAFDYIQGAGGIVQESSYPYTSGNSEKSGQCKSSIVSTDKVVNILHYYSIFGENAVAAYVKSTGPTTIYAYVEPWQTYSSGIMTVSTCAAEPADKLDHAGQIVGLVVPDSGASYWIVRNQWGVDWGMNGYIWLAYGTNTCGMFSDNAFTVQPQILRGHTY